ncbi:hypothetical protein MRX96_044939 [Rhipicephalus microplus]
MLAPDLPIGTPGIPESGQQYKIIIVTGRVVPLLTSARCQGEEIAAAIILRWLLLLRASQGLHWQRRPCWSVVAVAREEDLLREKIEFALGYVKDYLHSYLGGRRPVCKCTEAK